MKIGIYDPYLDTLGGGERYCFEIASSLANTNTVNIFWNDPNILARAQERFRIDMKKIHIVAKDWKQKGFFAYDIIFFVSDGSIPTSFAKKTYLIYQYPIPYTKNIINMLKLQKITGLICYSQFVQDFLKKQFHKQITVLAPPIDVEAFQPEKKEKLILSVGRFTKGNNTKKQEVLIEIFKRLHLKGWKLVFAGGMLESDADFVQSLKEHIEGYPIEILANISFEKLRELYAKAQVYWHAAGFGEDLETHPDKAEHFGITTIEAMSAGAVPLVFAGGGQNEIVVNGKYGFLWKTEEELIKKTRTIVENKNEWGTISKAAREHAKEFSRLKFQRNLMKLL